MASDRTTSIIRVQMSVVVKHDTNTPIKEVLDTMSVHIEGDESHGNANFIAARPLHYQKLNRRE